MIAKNEHTGDTLVSKPTTDEYREGFDRIFRQSRGCPTNNCNEDTEEEDEEE